MAKSLPTPYDAFLRRGNLLPSRNERSEVKGGDIALLTQSVASLRSKFALLECTSQCVKFKIFPANLT